ncbi:MAG: hypothetical protein A3I11_01700 [Elusimicrobia bacterium RIFCSPLOWO2_02_FULL_39_32]|nr:MAG: hypothetical protein A2034_04530 [Elusimicrobia bacterium GWA2_38_7]OGR78253.1 MAG: hypothetical protein A3B80_06185 [Elusimicrobia bacterium RIFCSPHIGHO2_02_FULL_39_36]OGR92391.1 MAG: hypothetical protein A3I11_01700 [Elusimicrobia bacterium RIFCSPLOWO2_02_FULL_39_32]
MQPIINLIILRPSHYIKRGMVFLFFMHCAFFPANSFAQNRSEGENRSMVLSNQDSQPRNEEEVRMKEKVMQLPPEKREKMIQGYKAKEMERREREEKSLYLSNQGLRQHGMSEEDKRMKEKIMQLPPEQRESAIQEYKRKKMREGESQDQTGMGKEEHQRMHPEERGLSAEERERMRSGDRGMSEMIHQLPPDQRGQAVKEYRREQEMKREMSSMEPSEEQKRQMTPEDRAMFQKIMQLPPEQREKAAQEYKMQRSNFYRQ